MMPMIPITPKVVNAISMSAIVNYLHSINKESHYKKYTCYYNPYPKAVLGELIGYQVTYNHKSHHELTCIIAILREVVYLLLFQHGNIKRAMDVPKTLDSESR
jgi:hypothetical protein